MKTIVTISMPLLLLAATLASSISAQAQAIPREHCVVLRSNKTSDWLHWRFKVRTANQYLYANSGDTAPIPGVGYEQLTGTNGDSLCYDAETLMTNRTNTYFQIDLKSFSDCPKWHVVKGSTYWTSATQNYRIAGSGLFKRCSMD